MAARQVEALLLLLLLCRRSGSDARQHKLSQAPDAVKGRTGCEVERGGEREREGAARCLSPVLPYSLPLLFS